MVEPIELTGEEQELWSQIYFPSGGIDHDKLRASIEPAYQLALSLVERDGIPSARRRYFTDPELNIRGRGKSYAQIFEQNGTKDEAILKHPNFHRFLRYFVLGPDLPVETKAAFSKLVSDCEPVTSSDTEAFCNLAREEVRRRHLGYRDAAEEFFKLGLELGLGKDTSRAVRDSVWRMR